MIDTDALIRERAYLLWEQAGRPEGRAEDFWHEAAAEIAREVPATEGPDAEKPAAEVPTQAE